MMDIITNNIFIIAGLLLLLTFFAYVVRQSRRKKKFDEAADVFRNRILTELKGLYPIPRHLKKSVFHRFRESIPRIESAAAEFRHCLPSGNRNSFDTALKTYCDHCNKITWESCATFGIVPGTRKPEDIGPKEIFRQNVNALLSFALER
jgi:hypothetical protein